MRASNIASRIPLLGVGPEGGFGGGQIGYNMLKGNSIFGGEADLQAASVTDSKSQVLPPDAPADAELPSGDKRTFDWFGFMCGRIGYVFDRTLVYGTGGFACGHIADEARVLSGPKRRSHVPSRALESASRSQRVMFSAALWSTSSIELGRPRLNINT